MNVTIWYFSDEEIVIIFAWKMIVHKDRMNIFVSVIIQVSIFYFAKNS
jgi:hypothetical protein